MDNWNNNDFDNSNIFNELSQDADIENTIKELKEVEERGLYYYLWFYSNIIKFVNYFLFFIIVVFFIYNYVQKSDTLYQNSYLDLVCPLVLWQEVSDNLTSDWISCSSVSSFLVNYKKDNLDTLEKSQYNKIISLLPDVYAQKLLFKSKDISFILNKNSERLEVFAMLSDFDELIKSYDYVDKNKVKCESITIDSEGILRTTCIAFSTDWDEWILWYDPEDKNSKVNWTAISVASSFLNYIEKSSTKFTLLDKQKKFSLWSVEDIGFYTASTNFTLELKYNWNNLTF